MAYLMTCGDARSVRSASRFHYASVGLASSDGRDLLRFQQSKAVRGDLDGPISIGWAMLLDDVELSSAIEEDRMATIKREPRSWLTIVVRSWPDRPTIGANSPLNQGRFFVGLKPRCRQRESLQ